MIRRPPRSTRTHTLYPYTTLFRSQSYAGVLQAQPSGGGLAADAQQQAFRVKGLVAILVLHGQGNTAVSHANLPIIPDLPDGDAVLREIAGQSLTNLRLGLRQQAARSEEHPSELQSLMRISYAVFCLQKTYTTVNINTNR